MILKGCISLRSLGSGAPQYQLPKLSRLTHRAPDWRDESTTKMTTRSHQHHIALHQNGRRRSWRSAIFREAFLKRNAPNVLSSCQHDWWMENTYIGNDCVTCPFLERRWSLGETACRESYSWDLHVPIVMVRIRICLIDALDGVVGVGMRTKLPCIATVLFWPFEYETASVTSFFTTRRSS